MKERCPHCGCCPPMTCPVPIRQKWTEVQLHELIMDLRIETGYPQDLHQKFYNILKPWFDAHNK